MKMFLVEALDIGYFDSTLKYAGDKFSCPEDKLSKAWMRTLKEITPAENASGDEVLPPVAAPEAKKMLNGAPVVDGKVKGGLGEPGAPAVGAAAPLAPPAAPAASNKPEEVLLTAPLVPDVL